MYPILAEPFGYPISTFGVMLSIAFLVGTWVTAVRMREEGLDGDLATTVLLYIMAGGLLGCVMTFVFNESFEWMGILVGPLVLALVSFVMILPFLILSFTSSFYRERLKKLLRLPTAEASPTAGREAAKL